MYIHVVYVYTHLFTCTVRGVIPKHVTSVVLCRDQIRIGAGHSDTCVCRCVSIGKVWRALQHAVNSDSLSCGRW